MPGTLYGVGLGPGDPELVTVKAVRIIGAADVIAYHCARHGHSIARSIAAPYLRADQIEEQLVYPVTTETVDHPGGYEGAMDEFYTHAAARLMAHLQTGRDVVLLAEGDPLFYSSYMHMHKRIEGSYQTQIVPGVTSLSAASAALKTPLVEGDDVLTVLPGTLSADELTERLARSDATAIMKIGRSFATVTQALQQTGRLENALYVERASATAQRTMPAADVDPSTVPYMSLVVVPGAEASYVPEIQGDSVLSELRENRAHMGRVDVVGLGPAGRDWRTPQAAAVLAAADDIVGYGPYVERVPHNPRQRRHASDNRVEAERAEFALELALSGQRVAVVSSGDPGVFAMATAVLEVAADNEKYRDVPVEVVPGVTAAQAVASQAGAPLGHDYVVLSLSDRLKPWDIIARRLHAAASGDFAIAIYNPASNSRRDQLVHALELLLDYRNPDTPVVIGRAVGTADQQVIVTTLGDLDPAQVDMRCLLIVGSSQSRIVNANTSSAGAATVDGVPVQVITPRRYPS